MNGSPTEAINRLGPIGLSILVQLSVVLTIALCLMWLFRRNPAARHLAGLCGIVSAILCPILLLAALATGATWLAIPLNRHIQSTQEAAEERTFTPDNARSYAPATVAKGGQSEQAIESRSVAPKKLARNHEPDVVDDSRAESVPSSARRNMRNDLVRSPLAYRPAVSQTVEESADGRPTVAANQPNVRTTASQTEGLPPGSRPTWSLAFHALVLTWGSGVVLLVVRGLFRRRRLRCALSRCRPAASDRLDSILDRVCRELGLRRRPVVVTSETLPLPVLVGTFRPRIVLPAAFAEGGSTAELRALVRHECAHIARSDLWVSLVQRWLAVIYWPHPLIHLLNRILSRTREELCDNHVLADTSAPAYARILLHIGERVVDAPALSTSLPLIGTRWSLEERIAGILSPDRRRETRAGWRSVVLASPVLMMAVGFASGIVVGDEAEGPATGNTANLEPSADQSGTDAQPIADEALRSRTAELLEAAESLVGPEMWRTRHRDHVLLDDALMLLNRPRPDPDVVDVLYRMMHYSWRRTPGESIRDFVERLEREASERADETATKVRKARQEYEGLTGAAWPLDWRARRGAWLDLVELTMMTASGEEVGNRWRETAAAHPEVRRMYRMAHLISVRQSEKTDLDYDFVQPLFSDGEHWSKRIRWTAELLVTLISKQVHVDDVRRTKARTRLLNLLREHEDEVDDSRLRLSEIVGSLHFAAKAQSAPEAHLLAALLIKYAKPHFFGSVAHWASISHEQRQALFLAKPVRLAPREVSLAACLDDLIGQVLIRVWVDPEVAASDLRITPTVTEGPWLKVLESLLEGTPYDLHSLGQHVLWIGPQANVDRAKTICSQAFVKTRTTRSILSKWLWDDIQLEFVETPLKDCVNFLRSTHNIAPALLDHTITIELLDMHDTPVTMKVHRMPLPLALSVLADHVGCDWCVSGKIFMGSPRKIAQVRDLEYQRVLRMSRLARLDNNLTRTLESDTEAEFIERSLADVAESVSKRHKVPFHVSPTHREDRVTVDGREVPLDLTLDLLCLKKGLAWETDGQSIFLGDAKDMAKVREEAAKAGEEHAYAILDKLGRIERAEAQNRALDPRGGANPFAGADPFAAPKPSEEEIERARRAAEERKKRELTTEERRLLASAFERINSEFWRAGEDHVFLDDGLLLLAGKVQGERPPNVYEVAGILGELMRRVWRKPIDQTAQEYLRELGRKSSIRSDETGEQLEQMKRDFRRISQRPWPMDWRAREDEWLNLVEMIITANPGEDVLQNWRQMAADDPLADLYRIAHLLSVREGKSPTLDYESVKPLFGEDRRADARLHWSTETLRAMLRCGVDAQDPRRVETRDTLSNQLQTLTAGGHGFSWQSTLPDLYREAKGQAAPEAPLLLRNMLVWDEPRHSHSFDYFASRAGFRREQIWALYFARPTTLPAQHRVRMRSPRPGALTVPATVETSLSFLLTKARVPIWVDDEVLGKSGGQPVSPASGTWLGVLEAVLSGTDFRLQPLDVDLFWIGHPDRLEAARKQYRHSLAKATKAGPRASSGLLSGTFLEFERTPLKHCIDFLQDQHDISFELLDQHETPVKRTMRNAPLHVPLTELTEDMNLDWCALDDVILIGSHEQIKQVNEWELPRLRRWSRLALLDSDVSRAVHENVRIEVVDKTLADVAKLLSEKHNVPVHVAAERRDDSLSIDAKNVSLDHLLDLICLKTGLAWHTDGQAIFIGDE